MTLSLECFLSFLKKCVKISRVGRTRLRIRNTGNYSTAHPYQFTKTLLSTGNVSTCSTPGTECLRELYEVMGLEGDCPVPADTPGTECLRELYKVMGLEGDCLVQAGYHHIQAVTLTKG